MFDVLVSDGMQTIPVARNLSKRDAKKKVKDLRQKGRKAQFVTAKGININELVDEFDLPDLEDEE